MVQEYHKIPINLSEDDKYIEIYAEMPGMETKDIKLDFYNNRLTIYGEKKPVENLFISDILPGKYRKIIQLSVCVTRKETVKRSYNNGILHVRILKFIEEENRFSLGLCQESSESSENPQGSEKRISESENKE